MNEEWGPWVEHDGKGCPCRGAFVESETRNGNIQRHIAEGSAIWPWGEPAPKSTGIKGSAWEWLDAHFPSDVIRYRIRKPRALIELRDMIADLPTPAERVDA